MRAAPAVANARRHDELQSAANNARVASSEYSEDRYRVALCNLFFPIGGNTTGYSRRDGGLVYIPGYVIPPQTHLCRTDALMLPPRGENEADKNTYRVSYAFSGTPPTPLSLLPITFVFMTARPFFHRQRFCTLTTRSAGGLKRARSASTSHLFPWLFFKLKRMLHQRNTESKPFTAARYLFSSRGNDKLHAKVPHRYSSGLLKLGHNS